MYYNTILFLLAAGLQQKEKREGNIELYGFFSGFGANEKTISFSFLLINIDNCIRMLIVNAFY